MMKLSVEQKFLIQQRAALGMALQDVLVSIGLSGDAAEDAGRDAEVQQLFKEGRSEGIAKIRERLTQLGLSGNASALRVLLQNRSDAVEDEQGEPWRSDAMTPEQFRAASRKIEPRVRAMFAWNRALIEGGEHPTEQQQAHADALHREYDKLCR